MDTSIPRLAAAARARLQDAGIDSVDADVRLLLEAATGWTRTELMTATTLSAAQAERFGALVERRATREPLQHITGVAHFRHVELAVGPGVFVPRPETEVMAGWVIDRLAGLPGAAGSSTGPDNSGGGAPVLVDLCTGSGAIARAVADEVPATRVHAVELSEDAAAWAARNLAGTGVDLRVGDMADAFTELDGTVDVVVCNPPYVPLAAWESVQVEARDHDPQLALFSGDDGLDAIRVLTGVAARLLKPGGWVACEHAEVQAEAVPDLFLRDGRYDEVRDHRDLSGRPRFTTARLRSPAGSRKLPG